MNSLMLITVTLILVGVSREQVSADVNLWEHAIGSGRNLSLPIPKQGQCISIVPMGLDGVISSAQTTECVTVWDNPDCTGASLEIQPPDDKQAIFNSGATMHEKTSAVGPCKPPPTIPPPPKPKGGGGKKKKKMKKVVKRVTVIG